jgi:hypothetical protein
MQGLAETVARGPAIRGSVAVLVAAAAYIAGFLLSAPEAELNFYTTAAQVIPVLLLALAIEARVFRPPQRKRWSPTTDDEPLAAFVARRGKEVNDLADYLAETAVVVAVPLSLAVGEIFALLPVMSGDAAGGHAKPVLASILAGLGGVVGFALVGPDRRIGSTRSDEPVEQSKPASGEEPGESADRRRSSRSRLSGW